MRFSTDQCSMYFGDTRITPSGIFMRICVVGDEPQPWVIRNVMNENDPASADPSLITACALACCIASKMVKASTMPASLNWGMWFSA